MESITFSQRYGRWWLRANLKIFLWFQYDCLLQFRTIFFLWENESIYDFYSHKILLCLNMSYTNVSFTELQLTMPILSLSDLKSNPLLILWEFHIMHSHPTHLPAPPYPPLTAQHPSQINEKLNRAHTPKSCSVLQLSNTSSITLVPLPDAVCHSVYPFVQSGPLTECSLQWAIGLVHSLGAHGNSCQTSCCCPQSCRSCGYHSVGPVRSHTPAGYKCGRC